MIPAFQLLRVGIPKLNTNSTIVLPHSESPAVAWQVREFVTKFLQKLSQADYTGTTKDCTTLEKKNMNPVNLSLGHTM